jgi:hypothetical protein
VGRTRRHLEVASALICKDFGFVWGDPLCTSIHVFVSSYVLGCTTKQRQQPWWSLILVLSAWIISIRHFAMLALIMTILGHIPGVSASAPQAPFPDIPFRLFSDFVHHNFNSDISLATVLAVLFTVTSNPNVLNLHARQQHPKAQGEVRQMNSSWIKGLAHALEDRLGLAIDSLFCTLEQKPMLSAEEVTNSLGRKLDQLSKTLNLHPYNAEGVFLGRLQTVSEQDIEPARIICPASIECETLQCHSRAILRQTRNRDVPKATLIQGTKIYKNVSVLSGQCSEC